MWVGRCSGCLILWYTQVLPVPNIVVRAHCRLLQKHFLRRGAELAASRKERRRAVRLALRFLQVCSTGTLSRDSGVYRCMDIACMHL